MKSPPALLGEIIAKKIIERQKMEGFLKYIDLAADLILLGLVLLAHYRISKLEKGLR